MTAGLVFERVLAACPSGVDPCNDTGPSSGGSPWFVVLVVAVVIAAAACLVGVIALLRQRGQR